MESRTYYSLSSKNTGLWNIGLIPRYLLEYRSIEQRTYYSLSPKNTGLWNPGLITRYPLRIPVYET